MEEVTIPTSIVIAIIIRANTKGWDEPTIIEVSPNNISTVIPSILKKI